MNRKEDNLLDMIPSNIYVINIKTYEFIYVNENVEKLIKQSKKILDIPNNVEPKCYTAIYGYDKPCQFCTINKFQDKREVIEFEVFNHVDNKWYSLRENLIYSSNGKVAKYSIGQDITELKKPQQEMTSGYAEVLVLKEEIQKLNRDLKKRVREEVAKNREKDRQLMEQHKMVQMGEMIGNIAHQWRQPLTAITISASGMQMEKDMDMLNDDMFQDYTEKIIERADFLSNTIEDFRNFLKEEKSFEKIDLKELIDSVHNIISAIYISNDIEMIINIKSSNNNFKLETVAGELSQVILNVLNNAKDIILEKDIKNKFVILTLEDHEDYFLISIEDSGGGVPEDILPKIFDPYFTTKHQSQGTGIGLYMSYKIVTQHLQGKMYVKNTQNGAKFYIELPKLTINYNS